MDKILEQLAAAITIAAAVIWLLQQFLGAKDCCAACAKGKSNKAAAAGVFPGAPARSGACG